MEKNIMNRFNIRERYHIYDLIKKNELNHILIQQIIDYYYIDGYEVVRFMVSCVQLGDDILKRNIKKLSKCYFDVLFFQNCSYEVKKLYLEKMNKNKELDIPTLFYLLANQKISLNHISLYKNFLLKKIKDDKEEFLYLLELYSSDCQTKKSEILFSHINNIFNIYSKKI